MMAFNNSYRVATCVYTICVYMYVYIYIHRYIYKSINFDVIGCVYSVQGGIATVVRCRADREAGASQHKKTCFL